MPENNNSMLNDKELKDVVGGVEETTYKYVFVSGDSVNAKADGSASYEIREDKKTNDGTCKIKCNFHTRGEGFKPSRGDDSVYMTTSSLMSFYNNYGGFLKGM